MEETTEMKEDEEVTTENAEEMKEAPAETEEKAEAKETSEGATQQGTDRKMYKATCSDCKKECEVPFEPAEGRPIYCRECYQKHKPRRRF